MNHLLGAKCVRILRVSAVALCLGLGGATGAGIQVRPTAGGTTGVIDRVIADHNVFGIAADGSGGASGVNISVRDSSATGNALSGIVAATGAVGTGVMVTRTAASNNGTGLQTAGSGAIMRVGQSEITGNGTGVSGTVLSYGTNQLNGNGFDGTLTAISPGPLH